MIANNYEKLVAHYAARIKSDVEAFRRGQPKSIYDYTVLRDEKGRDEGFKPVRMTLLALHETTPRLLHDTAPALLPDYEERVLKSAHESAAYQRRAFLFKNMTKMDSVLERRADFEKAEVLGQSLDLLDARISVAFKNGDRFLAKTQVVWVYDARYAFTRYPLTFHDIVLGGKHHAMFSEEQMNTVFALAEEGPDCPDDEAAGPRP